MSSPNPRGRPPGILDRRTKVTQALLDDGPAITRVVINAALEGDLHACGLVLSRIAPPLKGQAERLSFSFDATTPIARQIEQVLEAMATGLIAPDAGKTVIDAIGTLSSARAVEQLEERIAALEAKEGG